MSDTERLQAVAEAKARAAEAAVKAAQLQAEAAEALEEAQKAAEAAAAAGAAAEAAPIAEPAAAPTDTAPAAPAPAAVPAAPTAAAAAPAPPTAGPLDDAAVAAIRSGYRFDGPALEVGALVNGDALADVPVRIPLAMVNRHGLVAGATGTGKTKTLQVLAEQLSAAGVPVFAADIKGDLSGIAVAGESNEKLLARTRGLGQDWTPRASVTEFYSLGGVGSGVPIRATVAGFGPMLLGKVLGLNDTQESSLALVFHYADTAGLPLLDLKDLRAVLTYLNSADGKAELANLGGLSSSTVGVILRELIGFADAGADTFFGEPEIDTAEFLKLAPDGTGVVSLLEVPGVQDKPELFSTFLMWLLADLFNDLPEVGDLDKPKLVFFFDEAHLLFNGASKDFLQSITQTVRLIRSKGVGIFFVTQTPKDVPSDVLAQLGSRIQHQLRAFTPDDAKALKATVSTYPKSGYDLAEVLQTLSTGEAVVTVMNEKGAPSPVAWTRLRAPQGSMSAAPAATISAAIAASPLMAKYGTPVDRDSAHEMLTRKLDAAAAAADEQQRVLDQASAAVDAQKAADKAAKDQVKAQKQAEAEYNRLLKATGATARESSSSRSASSRSSSARGTVRRRTSNAPQDLLSEVLGSKAAGSLLSGVVEGIFGTRRRR